MSSHLPEKKTYAVCTNQLGSEYKELLADYDKRKVSVFYQKKFALLTTADKKLSDDFTCKTGWSKGLAGGAFLGGAAASFAVAASTAAIVPVIGWITAGVLAGIAIGYALYQIFTAPKCSGALGNISSQWKLYHPKVYYNKNNALLSCSILQCGEGGVLLPFLSKNLANKAAQSIANNNRVDIGLGVIVSGVSGFGMAELLLAGNVQALVISLLIGNYIIPPSASWVGDTYANIYRDKRYTEIETAMGEKKEDKAFMDYILGAANPKDDTQKVIKNSNEIIANMKANGVSKAAIAAFEKSVVEAKRTGSLSNKESVQVLADIKKGKYGTEAQKIFTNKSGNARGMHTEKNYDKAGKAEHEKIYLNRCNSAKNLGSGGITVLGIVQPFISAVLNKRSLLLAKEAQEKEAEKEKTNSITVVSADY